MQQLTPAEFVYLDRIYWADDTQMLKLNLQELCLLKILTVTRRQVVENKKDRRSFPRYFFSRGPNFKNDESNSSSHNFFLQLFSDREELKFAELKNAVVFALNKKIDRFAKDYTYHDLVEKGFVRWLYFKTREGRRAHEKIVMLLDETDKHVDYMLEKDRETLLRVLDQMGTHVLLLEKETIRKLKIISKEVEAIGSLEFLNILDSNHDSFDSFFYMTNFDFVSGSSFDDGGFDGFGGGDGGGGGGGSEW